MIGDFFYPEQLDYHDWAEILIAYAAAREAQARKQGYEEGIEAAIQAATELSLSVASAKDDGIYGGIAMFALQEMCKAIRALSPAVAEEKKNG